MKKEQVRKINTSRRHEILPEARYQISHPSRYQGQVLHIVLIIHSINTRHTVFWSEVLSMSLSLVYPCGASVQNIWMSISLNSRLWRGTQWRRGKSFVRAKELDCVKAVVEGMLMCDIDVWTPIRWRYSVKRENFSTRHNVDMYALTTHKMARLRNTWD